MGAGWIVVGVLLGGGGILACCFEKFGLGVFLFVSATISFIIAAIMAGLTWGSGGPGGAVLCSLFAVACAVGLVICIVRGITEGWTDPSSIFNKENRVNPYLPSAVKTKEELIKEQKINVIDKKLQTVYILYDNLKDNDESFIQVAKTTIENNLNNEFIADTIKEIAKDLYKTIDEKEIDEFYLKRLESDFIIRNGVLLECKNKNIKIAIIPCIVTSIGKKAFVACDQLQKVVIPSSVYEIGDFAFENCKSLRTINLPSSIRTIGCYAFAHDISLSEVIIPNGVTIIPTNTFAECGEVLVRIPLSVREIERHAFSGAKIVYEGSVWDWGKIKKPVIMKPYSSYQPHLAPHEQTYAKEIYFLKESGVADLAYRGGSKVMIQEEKCTSKL